MPDSDWIELHEAFAHRDADLKAGREDYEHIPRRYIDVLLYRHDGVGKPKRRQTTKRAFAEGGKGGTGFGLAIVNELPIRITSKLDEGTEVF